MVNVTAVIINMHAREKIALLMEATDKSFSEKYPLYDMPILNCKSMSI